MPFHSWILLGIPIVVFSGAIAEGQVPAEELRFPPVTTIARLSFVPEDNPAIKTPPAPILKPDFEIEDAWVRRMHVVEPPEQPGLPQPEGEISLTVRTVADPGLPDPPKPVATQFTEDPEFNERLVEWNADHHDIRLAFVSATVYDHSRTRLTVHLNGDMEKTVTVWSNLDFNHFTGFGSFVASDCSGEVRNYALLMGIGNEDTVLRRRVLEGRGFDYEEPEIPTIPDGPPAFVIETIDPTPNTLTLIEDLHALYRSEGPRMAEIRAARDAAYQARKSELLANPPKPKDITIHFWKRIP